MSTNERAACTDCGGALHAIQILERGHLNSLQTGLKYTLPEAKRSFWTGRFPVEGDVAALICEKCGRILLYGIPKQVE